MVAKQTPINNMKEDAEISIEKSWRKSQETKEPVTKKIFLFLRYFSMQTYRIYLLCC